jgi:flavodoxin
MKTLVVYDSVHGNTERVAHAIGDALPGEVRVMQVEQVDPADWEAADLLVIGSPTHGSLPTAAIQQLIERIGFPSHADARAATFDTRLTWFFLEPWGGFAAPKMAEALAAKGWTLVGDPGGFYVRGLTKGPLKRGQLERAAVWAAGLAG